MKSLIIPTTLLLALSVPALAQGPGGTAASGNKMGQGTCAIVFHGTCRSSAWLARREKCARLVQHTFGGGGFDEASPGRKNKTQGGPAALRSCMHGGPI
jgi:hypothetical protein